MARELIEEGTIMEDYTIKFYPAISMVVLCQKNQHLTVEYLRSETSNDEIDVIIRDWINIFNIPESQYNSLVDKVRGARDSRK